MPIHLAALRRSFPGLTLALGLALGAAQVVAAPGEAVDPLINNAVPVTATVPAPADAPSDRPSLLRQVHARASSMVVAAMDFVGVRYKRGGVSAETGFDCSGFTRHVFEMSLGLVLPRRAEEQAMAPGLIAVRREDLKPGDLVFFNTLKRTFSHVGIYIGDNRFIHSPRPGQRVRTEDMSFSYWAKRFTGGRRAEAPEVRETAVPTVPTSSAVAGE